MVDVQCIDCLEPVAESYAVFICVIKILDHLQREVLGVFIARCNSRGARLKYLGDLVEETKLLQQLITTLGVDLRVVALGQAGSIGSLLVTESMSAASSY